LEPAGAGERQTGEDVGSAVVKETIRGKRKGRFQGPTIAGFALLEIAAAAGLGTLMLLALYLCFVTGFAIVRNSRENLRATQVIVERLEDIRHCAFSQITNSIYNPPRFTAAYDPKQRDGGLIYHGTITSDVPPIGSVPDVFRANVLMVTVGVSWTSGSICHTQSMRTLIPQDGFEGCVSTGD
jgi:hypothetical protein